ncbi:methyltransferase type 11 [Streptomyces sp. NPDC057854]|uniref:methyltransferase type 11 n=1 Tax=unclassified Streptomyces TaxID=2593676 RepID=UPI0036A62A9B
MDWETHAIALADRVTDPDSRWLPAVAGTARHRLIPAWWEKTSAGWELRRGADDTSAWMAAAYSDLSLVTRVGPLHADHAQPGDNPTGVPTSSATLPGLVVQMLRHGRLGDGLSVLDLGTGAGGLTAYACHRYGADCVTSLDVDPYLTEAAGTRLASLGHHPKMVTADATEHIPGLYERIVSTVGLLPGPGLRPTLDALMPGGRIATTLGRTCLIVTGWKHASGDVVGTVARDMAGFMLTRSEDDYPPDLSELLALALTAEGEERSTGRYPVVDLSASWELRSMLEVTCPGVEFTFASVGDLRTTRLAHPDGSWARATGEWTDPPEVHQGGPRRLWTELERIRTRLLTEGSLPLLGARVRITPDGVVHLSRGQWRATMGA